MILGSASPRRKELLSIISNEFNVQTIEVDETIDNYKSPTDLVKKIASKKIKAYLKQFGKDEVIICADTIVVKEDMILGKPKDKEDALRMINLINDSYHYVYTCVSISYYGKIKTFLEKTKVYVTKINDEEIDEYINTKEPYDKAGAYAIQGAFAKFITKIDGDYYNVMGLPVSRLYQELKQLSNK